MNATELAAYFALRLNSFSEASWAVICRPSGAIALDPQGRLMTKMTEADATARAAQLSCRQKPLDEPCPG